jgi:adenine-specific DNA-methyltransferase
LLWNRVPFYLIQEIVWNYGAGVAGSKFFSPRNEKFLWYVKNSEEYTFNLDDIRDPNVKYPNQKKNGKIKVNALGKNPTDVWEFPKVTSGKNRASKERTPHPAQFPIAVIQRIIKASSHQNEIVLDPFMGSGTTAIVALALQRQVIGFEIRQDYCDLAASRIDQFLKDQQFSIEELSFSASG